MQRYVDYLRELGHPDAEKRAAELDEIRREAAGGSAGSADTGGNAGNA